MGKIGFSPSDDGDEIEVSGDIIPLYADNPTVEDLDEWVDE